MDRLSPKTLFSGEALEESTACAKCGKDVITIYQCHNCHMTFLCADCMLDHLRCDNSFPQVAQKNHAISIALASSGVPEDIKDVLREAL